MENILKEYLQQLKIGHKQVYKNLALYPLLSTYTTTTDYLTLDEALAAGVIEVMEVSKEGHVPELKVINKSPRLVLILDGEELVGAKQNRIVNTTILVAANATMVIPVSCVEQGRWTYKSPTFQSQERIMSSNLRAMKSRQVFDSLKSHGEFRSRQGEIWEEIEAKAARMKAPSGTMAMSDIYEKESSSLEEYLRHFRPVEGQVGAVFMINDKVVGIDAFGKPATLSRMFKKLFQSYALDAVDWFDPKIEYKALKSKVTKFLEASMLAESSTHPSVGSGTDCRLESKTVTGFALMLEKEILHLQKLFLPLLENSEIGPEIKTKIHYVMVDEYQDTNYVQEQLLLQLAGKNYKGAFPICKAPTGRNTLTQGNALG